MKYFFIAILTITVLISCKKDETLINGDITGEVILVDRFYNNINPETGIKVVLYSENKLIDSTQTNQYGAFTFNNLPYGRYDIFSFKPGFIRSWAHSSVFHVGGYSPTIYQDNLYEIPKYQVELDSTVTYFPEDWILAVPLTIDGDTVLPGNDYSYMFRVFMSNSPDVSSENYTAIGKGIVADWSINYVVPVATYGRIVSYEIRNFDQVNTQPVYMIFYPIANNQGYSPTDFLKESLGPPSNVISFNWNEISGK